MQKLGFGFLRLPQRDPENAHDIDFDRLNGLVDAFFAGGGSYFDTAYTYLDGDSERALRRCVVDRYPRDCYQIADKLPSWLLREPADCERYFQESLDRCGVTYFDYYLLHGLDRTYYRQCLDCGAFDFVRQCKAQGRVGKIGFSFHGDAALLEEILTAQPGMEFVQLQINYLDWDSPAIQSRDCYEVACRHGLPVLVMEPVKGGMLADLPDQARALLSQSHPDWSPASWAMAFVRDLEQVRIVLSGMNAMEQMTDNLQARSALTARERTLLDRAAAILRSQMAVDCTGCNYCGPNCPQEIPIPRVFALYNEYMRRKADRWKIQPVYDSLTTDCIACGACEAACPQKLPIRQRLQESAAAFEKTNG